MRPDLPEFVPCPLPQPHTELQNPAEDQRLRRLAQPQPRRPRQCLGTTAAGVRARPGSASHCPCAARSVHAVLGRTRGQPRAGRQRPLPGAGCSAPNQPRAELRITGWVPCARGCPPQAPTPAGPTPDHSGPEDEVLTERHSLGSQDASAPGTLSLDRL